METRASGSTTTLRRSDRGSKSYRQSYGRSVNGTSYFATGGGASRRLTTSRRAPTPHHDITEKVDAEQLALLVKREWQLSYVTPLYKFRHAQLKSYSRMLSAFIIAEKQQGVMEEEVGLDAGFKVSFSVIAGMAETPDDAETVFIQIHSKPAFARQDESHKVAWSGWLTCVNGDADFLRSLPEDFVSLPLFCSAGAEGLTSLVKTWFQRTFDCCFGRLELNPTVLQWLAALWTECHPEADIQQLELSYVLPVAPPLSVAYAFKSQDVWELWRSARETHRQQEEEEGKENRGGGAVEEEEAIDIKEVKRFFKGLEGHFYRHFRVHLTAGKLSQVSTALGSAKCGGRVKIVNKKYMITTLTLLTEMAVLKMPI